MLSEIKKPLKIKLKRLCKQNPKITKPLCTQGSQRLSTCTYIFNCVPYPQCGCLWPFFIQFVLSSTRVYRQCGCRGSV